VRRKVLLNIYPDRASSPYGAKRAALGQAEPWTSIFSVIHLELGNEEWNAGVFAGIGYVLILWHMASERRKYF
jgi:alpha-L-arabinofuranosidase